MAADPRRRRGSPATCPERVARRARRRRRRRLVPRRARARRPGPAELRPGRGASSTRRGRARPGPARPPATRASSSGSSGSPSATTPATTSRSCACPGLDARVPRRPGRRRDARAESTTAFAGGPVIFVSAHFGPIELPALYLAHRSGRDVRRPDGDGRRPAAPGLVRARRAARSASGSSGSGRRGASCSAALRRPAATSGSSPTATSRGGGIEVPFFGAPAPFPIGPALLAIETGAPIAAVGVRRLADGRVAGRLTARARRRRRARAASGSRPP